MAAKLDLRASNVHGFVGVYRNEVQQHQLYRG